jgi:deazaflavin-dependent oxidoreductase (nitroreductase family)
MSDETSAAISAVRMDWVVEHREKYLNSGGVQGHIENITAVGGPAMGTHLLLKYVGRKSGRVFITPLCYGMFGGAALICASKGGADHHPEWYLNLREMDEVDFQIGTQAFRGTQREPEGIIREKAWEYFTHFYPFYANYQTSTTRLLPLVLLRAVKEINIFSSDDATGIRQA